MDRVPAPTEVPKELATSLPPMLKAMKQPKMMVTIMSAMWAPGLMLSLDQKINQMRVAAVIKPKNRCHVLSFPRPDAGEAVPATVGLSVRVIFVSLSPDSGERTTSSGSS